MLMIPSWENGSRIKRNNMPRSWLYSTSSGPSLRLLWRMWFSWTGYLQHCYSANISCAQVVLPEGTRRTYWLLDCEAFHSSSLTKGLRSSGFEECNSSNSNTVIGLWYETHFLTIASFLFISGTCRDILRISLVLLSSRCWGQGALFFLTFYPNTIMSGPYLLSTQLSWRLCKSPC